MEFGSGVLMVCSFGDQNDVAVFRELGLDPFQAIDLEGRMTALAGPLAGMTVLEARRPPSSIWNRPATSPTWSRKIRRFPSQSAEKPVEIILLKEWYVRQTHMQDRLRSLSKRWSSIRPATANSAGLDGQHLHRLAISDAGGTTQRFQFGMRIRGPRSSFRQRELTCNLARRPTSGSRVLDRNDRTFLGTWDDLASELSDVVGEEKVFDTWMDSSNSNLFVSGLLEDDDRFERCFPTALRPQGKEIVRTWLYYTMLKSALLLDQPAFKHVWIDGLGMDPWGRKMSKSLGNGIDADSVIECGPVAERQLAHQGTRRLRGPQGQQDWKRMFPLVEGLRRPSRR